MVFALALLLFQAPVSQVSQANTQQKAATSAQDVITLASFDNLPIKSTASFLPGYTELTPAPPPDLAPAALDDLPFAPEAAEAQPFIEPVLPAPKVEERKRPMKLWWALASADHAAAGFDAWSTRRFVQNGTGRELNLFYRPFAGSNLLYAAVQVAPTALDYVARRMMTSEHPLFRRTWWLPQSLGTVASLASGAHNLTIH
jgi:hypothetical protein